MPDPSPASVLGGQRKYANRVRELAATGVPVDRDEVLRLRKESRRLDEAAAYLRDRRPKESLRMWRARVAVEGETVNGQLEMVVE